MTLSIAFLGSGFATRLHSRTLAGMGVRRFYASRDAGRAAATNATYRGAGHFAGYDAALASRDVDAVLITLPPALHLEWTLAALAHGKHVIVEKPPFLHAADFARVEAAAKAADRQVMVAENYYYKPLATLLRRTLSEAWLGEPLFLTLNALKKQRTGDWRDDATLAGGGALFEGGIHWMSLLANIGLEPRRVRAARPGPRLGHDRSMLVTLEYAEGAVATLHYSWDLPGVVNGVRFSRVYGRDGSLTFETNGIIAFLAGRRTRVLIPGLRDLAGYRAMFADFVPALVANRAPAFTLALARRDLQLVEQAYASLET